MNFSKIRLITFDVTGTLLQFNHPPGKQYAQVGALYGIVCDHNLLSTNFINNWRKMSIDHPNFGLHSGLGWENWWRKIVYNTFKEAKQTANDDKLHQVATHLLEEYKNRHFWQITRGALDLLSYLRHKGIVLGVISNYDPRLEATLENNKIKHYFRFILSSYNVGVEKPHSKIFKEAIKVSNIKDLKPEQCMHIGDSVSLDYLGATNAGWNSVVILSKDRAIHSESSKIHENHIFYSLYDLHHHIMNSNGHSLSSAQRKVQKLPQ